MTDPFARYPLPWRVADFDGRVVIVASTGAKVTEVSPGQHGGRLPEREDVRAIAEAIVELVNCPLRSITKGRVDLRGLPWCGQLDGVLLGRPSTKEAVAGAVSIDFDQILNGRIVRGPRPKLFEGPFPSPAERVLLDEYAKAEPFRTCGELEDGA